METDSEIRYEITFTHFPQAFNGVNPKGHVGPVTFEADESWFHAVVVNIWGFTFDPRDGSIKGMPFCKDPVEQMVNADTVVGHLLPAKQV